MAKPLTVVGLLLAHVGSMTAISSSAEAIPHTQCVHATPANPR